MSEVYFPAFNGEADCNRCELVDWSDGRTYGKADCPSYGKSQRNRRDFTYTSGRCPKLPDQRGLVHESQRANQRKAYPLIHAERTVGGVLLRISLPAKNNSLCVYKTRSGFFYFNSRDKDGYKIKRLIFIGGNKDYKDIVNFMESRKADYCVFDCEITDCTV